MIHRAIQSREKGPVAAAARVSTIKGRAQAHIDDVRMDGGTGSILDSCDQGCEGTGAGIFQNFDRHKFGVRSDALRTDAVYGSGHNPGDVSGMAEFPI